MKISLVIALWFLGLVFTLVGFQMRWPYLIFLSGSGAWIPLVASLVMLGLLIRQGTWCRAGGKLLILLWCQRCKIGSFDRPTSCRIRLTATAGRALISNRAINNLQTIGRSSSFGRPFGVDYLGGA